MTKCIVLKHFEKHLSVESNMQWKIAIDGNGQSVFFLKVNSENSGNKILSTKVNLNHSTQQGNQTPIYYWYREKKGEKNN